jgi:hypothetical protein
MEHQKGISSFFTRVPPKVSLDSNGGRVQVPSSSMDKGSLLSSAEDEGQDHSSLTDNGIKDHPSIEDDSTHSQSASKTTSAKRKNTEDDFIV